MLFRSRSGVLQVVEARLQGTGPDLAPAGPAPGGAAKVIPMSAKARTVEGD